MSKTVHFIFIWTMVIITVLITIYLIYSGYSYYNTVLEERFYHPRHDWFKPSGVYGHGLGIVGTLMILFGVVIYIARKRYNFLSKYIRLKYLLEFHIFLCSLGPILILFHTAFKFGGVVSIAFWSMVAVVLSGVIGRFIYIQIPRSIEGRAFSLNEVKIMKSTLGNKLVNDFNLDQQTIQLIIPSEKLENQIKKGFIANYISNRRTIVAVNNILLQNSLDKNEIYSILEIVKEEMSLSNKIDRLESMQKLFKYWHVAHLPFALIMLLILIIHVGVTLAFGYKWIF